MSQGPDPEPTQTGHYMALISEGWKGHEHDAQRDTNGPTKIGGVGKKEGSGKEHDSSPQQQASYSAMGPVELGLQCSAAPRQDKADASVAGESS